MSTLPKWAVYHADVCRFNLYLHVQYGILSTYLITSGIHQWDTPLAGSHVMLALHVFPGGYSLVPLFIYTF